MEPVIGGLGLEACDMSPAADSVEGWLFENCQTRLLDDDDGEKRVAMARISVVKDVLDVRVRRMTANAETTRTGTPGGARRARPLIFTFKGSRWPST